MNTAPTGSDEKSPDSTEPSVPTPLPPDSPGWVGALPMIAILTGLVALGLWGHHTDWKFIGSGHNGEERGEKTDWCPAHGVQESLCIECNPELSPGNKSFGWCQVHGVAECPLCHPELAQVSGKAQVSQAQRGGAQRALTLVERTKNNPQCLLHKRRLQFPTAEAAQKVGIEPAAVVEGLMVEFLSANGEIGYDQTRVARLSTRTPGTAWLVLKQHGDRVQKGEVLALVDAAEVGRAKAEFLQAFAQVNLKAKVWESLAKLPGVTAERTIQEAAAALREARIRLLSAQQALINLGLPLQADEFGNLPEDKLAERVRFLGLPPSLTQTFDLRTTTTNLLPIKAPMDGVVVAREVVAGEAVDNAKVLFVVADIRRMWLNLDVQMDDAKLLTVGLPVRFQADGQRQEISGKLSWVSTSVEEKTRTVRVRAELDNPEGKLRAGTFGVGRIILREEKNAIVVPKEAVHWEGCCHVVFVRDKDFLKGGPKVFYVRKVVPGARDAANVEIIAGLLPGEVVAGKGSGYLRDELLKNNLKAECKHAR